MSRRDNAADVRDAWALVFDESEPGDGASPPRVRGWLVSFDSTVYSTAGHTLEAKGRSGAELGPEALPPAGDTFVVSYVRSAGAREAIEARLRAAGDRLGVDYILAA
jgi:hypothetical protein